MVVAGLIFAALIILLAVNQGITQAVFGRYARTYSTIQELSE
jgi:hypothetical protein